MCIHNNIIIMFMHTFILLLSTATVYGSFAFPVSHANSLAVGSFSPMLGVHKFLYTCCPQIQLSNTKMHEGKNKMKGTYVGMHNARNNHGTRSLHRKMIVKSCVNGAVKSASMLGLVLCIVVTA